MVEFLKFEKSNCKNCYKCIRHCPVKSIRFSGNLATVIQDECILCGNCFVVCPQNAKQIAEEREIVEALLNGKDKVIASVAPSFAAYFKELNFTSLERALKELGFSHAEETAKGALMVKKEYEKIVLEEKQNVIITSCCHTINLIIEKYYPKLVKYLAPVKTPMYAHATDIKRRYPKAKIVFIGPCLSKKDEAYRDKIDAALTFDELNSMFEKAKITLKNETVKNEEKGLTRLFPTNGGILKSMLNKNPLYTYISVDGIENCKNVLEDIQNGEINHCFIEMSSCIGSCSNGPIMQKKGNTPLTNYNNVIKTAKKKDFDIKELESKDLLFKYTTTQNKITEPSEEDILNILKQMGKTKKEDELNCGSCGYDTCKEKAKAIYYGKAEITMCLPFLMKKSESFTNNILDNTPNGIMVVNEHYEIDEINNAAQKLLNIKQKQDVLGEPLVRIINPSDFILVREKKEKVFNKRNYYAEFDKFLELTIVEEKVSKNLIAIFRDVSNEENENNKKKEISKKTIEVADKVVEKQMRIVQEIASLLGETTAETKIALTKLKDQIRNEDSE
ncbi:MAG: [Fe-Fe] hydrogenase large subunit C-terminal domain-containing protein [Eubacteriales bacterium]|nr:[Fe-Fe] hydrogenase large subunit C-terminal domain-containing protein [Eubacteriales bacterium]